MMVIKGFDSILVNYPLTDNQIIYLIESHSNKMSDCELDKIEKWVLEEEDITPEKLIILNYNCLEAPLSREEKMESRRVLSEKILGRKFHE